MFPYVVVAAVVLAGMLLFAAAMAARRMLAPAAPTAEKLTTYESGVDPVGEGWAQTNVRYFLYAFLYVIFAVDAVYLFPWATVIRRADLGAASLVEMAIFVSVLLIGLGARRPPRPAAVGLRVPGRCRPPCRCRRSARPPSTRRRPIKVVLNWGRRYSAVGLQLRAGLLRHRVHRRLDGPPRLHPARRHPLRPGPAPGRPDGGVGHRHGQDGPGDPPPLRPDARAQVRHLLRRLLQQRRPVLGLLLRHQGRRPADPRRRLRAGLPAAARGADPGHPAAAGEDRRREPHPAGACGPGMPGRAAPSRARSPARWSPPPPRERVAT